MRRSCVAMTEYATAEIQIPLIKLDVTLEQGVADAAQRIQAQMNAQSGVEASGVDVGVNLNIDINALIGSIANAIADAIHQNAQREAFVKTLLETVTSSIGGSHNIMIFNMQQGFEFNPDWSSTWFTSETYAGIQFGIWVFRGPVQFVNQGDGGWINWGFFGVFDRNGGVADFHQL
jgi:hypothetical protein